MDIKQNEPAMWRNPQTEVRVVITEWLLQEPIEDQYITYPASWWLIWNYVKKVGVVDVIRKIRSRLAERSRNNKVSGLGIGHIVEYPKGKDELKGKSVLFFAPNTSPLTDNVVLIRDFWVLLPGGSSSAFTNGQAKKELEVLPAALRNCKAWSPWSGNVVDTLSVQKALQAISVTLALSVSEIQGSFRVASERITRKEMKKKSKPSAVLFGLGNYAKTQIIPNISSHLSLERIHEIDPNQFEYLKESMAVDWDTAPMHRGDRDFDVWFIAGYHHTHADLAMAAIRQKAVAVVEKPLAVNREQFESLSRTLEQAENPGFFSCFHKRYSKLHELFLLDKGCPEGEPIDMHCIVYEIPLPAHHWYNWPNSGSRLISNGCHWIDYFMFINGFSAVDEMRKWSPGGKDVYVQLKLKNGACFSMSLTEKGSQRLGVRENIELRVGGVTVSMVDGAVYRAENRNRVLRKVKINPELVYARMYKSIIKKILSGQSGDTMKSLRSTEVTILLEELN